MKKAYCTTCHAWVEYEDTPSGRHEHQPLVRPILGRDPEPGTYAAIILEAMFTDSERWWSTWDLVPLIHSVHVRDILRAIKEHGWTLDERWTQTEGGKRFKVWKLVLPKPGQDGMQGGLF